jgi:hypothetical protein
MYKSKDNKIKSKTMMNIYALMMVYLAALA